MNKSITIVCEEFKNNFADLINDSGLPACVIELILESYLRDVKLIAKNQYDLDKKQYEEAVLAKGNSYEKENGNK